MPSVSKKCHLLYPRCGCPAPITPADVSQKPARKKAPGPPKVGADRAEWRTGQPKSPWKIAQEQAIANPDADAIALEKSLVEAIRYGKAQDVLKAFEVALAKASFAEFCQQAWHVVEPTTRLQWSRHHQLICTTLQALFEDWRHSQVDMKYVPLVKNTLMNLSPGSLKSRIISVFFNAFVWLRNPGWKLICISVNNDAAMRDARMTRELIRSDWYQRSFQPTWSLKADQDAISDFGTTSGGGRVSRPSGSVIVGLRGDCLIGDDLNDPHESENKTAREFVNELWDTNQYNRVNDPLRSLRICVQQRTHTQDHSGHVVRKQGIWTPANKDGWMVVCLPAEFEISRPAFQLPEHLKQHVQGLPNVELCDWRIQEGEILHPARMTPAFLAGEKKRWAGTSNYAGQMQQRPSAEGGGKIKKKWFNFFRLARGVREDIDQIVLNSPRQEDWRQTEATVIHAAQQRPTQWDFDQVVLTVDPAYKKTDAGSLWGMLAVGCKQARKYVLDDRSQRGEPDEMIVVMKSLVIDWRPSKILIEDKAGGYDMHRTLQLAMSEGDVPMVHLELVNPGTQDKEQRLNAAIPTLANGMIWLLDGAPWLDAFMAEMGDFPNGTHNDRVDALTQAINHIREDVVELPDASAWARALG